MVEYFLKYYVSNKECMYKLIHIGYKRMSKLLMNGAISRKDKCNSLDLKWLVVQSLPHCSASTGVAPSAYRFLFLLHTVISPWLSTALFSLYRLPKVRAQTQYVRQAFFAPRLLLKYQTIKNLFIWKDCLDGFLWTSQMVKKLERYWQLSKS